ncbi:TRAP transporter, 4TM/12TM fusion protein [Natronorubrum sediminis]|uniref:TRAP transporter, 4TM/12TM fusion protein n=1 Tax=Natronorubrum sediminis TaxID=640943 RepID=A0A1H6G535_9EURY|nr:TRAP transporter fused permease subunit [Natronorubrum sediminis]SEH18191.1 TRAP transporter, 4TM/12TM fusion protein [Natronorubrum sediminis]
MSTPDTEKDVSGGTDSKGINDFPQILPRSRSELSVRRFVRILLYTLAVITVVWHLYYASSGRMPRSQHANIHLGLMLSVFYLASINFSPSGVRDKVDNAISAGLFVTILATTAYVHVHYWRWLRQAREQYIYTNVDVLVGAVIMLITIHATWKAYGKLLGFVTVGAIGYGYFGPVFPGILNHGGFDIETIIYSNSVALNGVYGFLLGVGATWVVIFILFAGIIESYGGMDYVIKIGRSVGRRISSGIPQVAIVSSMLMGSITGSSAANVATTGSFTIPLMQDNRVGDKYAASIESIASTGGQILPPVMGSAAFLMADLIGVSFVDIIQAAILPAVLFYIGMAFVVHLSAHRYGWLLREGDIADVPDEERVGPVEMLVSTAPYTIPLLVLIYTLVVLRWDPMSAGLYAILALIPAALIRDLILDPSSMSTVNIWGRRTIEGCKIGVVNMAPLTAVLASLGIVIQIISQTGFALSFSLQMVAIAGGVFFVVLFLAMTSSLLFGLGMPTPAAYVVVAVLTAPGLVQLGLGEITAHMFVFYFALLSTITPPVALSCAVACGIAGASFFDVCKETIRLGLFSFMIPWVFVFNQELIYWDGMTTALVFLTSSVGILSVVIALVGYDLQAKLNYASRALYLVFAFAIWFVPNMTVKVGLSIAFLVWVIAVFNETVPSLEKIIASR